MNRSDKILVIEDDEVLGGAISQRLKLEDFDVHWSKTCSDAIQFLRLQKPCFILSDIRLPDGSGEDLFRRAQPFLGETPILFATAFGEIDQAVRLVKAGAEDYLTKPYDVEELIERIRSRLAKNELAPRHETTILPAPASSEILKKLERVAATDLPLLLTGETGVGKEVAARFVHKSSSRAELPFVAVNCGAVPAELLESQFFGHERGAFTGANQTHLGFFEEAGEGTLFLDEIGELDTKLQTALLRVLEDGWFRPVGSRNDRKFRGRIIAATNANIDDMRIQRRFRDDLYYRLSVIELALPPLRERIDEILPIAEYFIQDRQGTAVSFSEDAIEALLNHNWPGNIRELRNRVSRALVFAGSKVLDAHDLFPESRLDEVDATSLASARRQAEADQIEKALISSEGNVGEAAKKLGISRTTLWKRRKG
jgi:DNA-binding NtrC family response regulator